MIKKKRIVLVSVLLILLSFISIYTMYKKVYISKQIVYIPKSLNTSTLYESNEKDYYLNQDFEFLNVYSINNDLKSYDIRNMDDNKAIELIEYLNKFKIREIKTLKVLENKEPRNVTSVDMLTSSKSYIHFFLTNKFSFSVAIIDEDKNGIIKKIDKSYLIEDRYIDFDYIDKLFE